MSDMSPQSGSKQTSASDCQTRRPRPSEALAFSDDEILAAVEQGLAAQGRRETVIEPRMHLVPDKTVPGHFNVLRGAIRAPINLAGVKVISDYVDNYKQGLPSELGLLLLMDPTNGAPKAIIDGSHLTDMRTGAVTAIRAAVVTARPSPSWRPSISNGSTRTALSW
jgi:alanine dehydrogenase